MRIVFVPRAPAYHHAAHVVIGAALGFEPDPLSCVPRERSPDLLGTPQDRGRGLTGACARRAGY